MIINNFMQSMYDSLKILDSKKLAIITLLGFSSGLPLALSGGTLQAWLATTPATVTTIGLFALVGLPYTLKFLWAPILDRFEVLKIGRRKSWILLTQTLIAVMLLIMATINPSEEVYPLAVLALMLSFLSASQDIAFDAFRTDSLNKNERGLGAGLSVLGYRVGMIVSGALALILADKIGFGLTYSIMGVIMATNVFITLVAQEPNLEIKGPQSFHDAVINPFVEFFSQNKHALLFLALVVLYKLGDAFAGTLTTTFLIRGPQFSLSEIGTINKTLGLFLSIFGAIFGGVIMSKIGLFRSLLYFGILQAISNLSFFVMALVGKNFALFIFAVAFEQLSGGMGTAAFVALLMSLCNPRYTATQFAMLSAASAIGRVFVGPPSGFLVEILGWAPFFLLTFMIAIPGILLLYALQSELNSYS